MKKSTPSNCRYYYCHWNHLPPRENSQECVACEGNKNPQWRPAGRRKKS